MDEELKKLLEDQTKAIHAGRDAMDEKFSKYDACTEDKLKKIKAEIAEKETALQEKLDARDAELETIKKQMEEFETQATRPGTAAGGKSDAEKEEEVKLFNAWARGEISESEMKAYSPMSDEEKTMVTNVGSSGGFFVPTNTREGLIERRFRSSPMRALATIERGPIFETLVERGEITTAATTETGSRSVTGEPDFHKVTIDTHERYAMPKVSNRMLVQSTFDVQNYLMRKAAQKFGRDEAYDFIQGDGASKPRGFLTYSVSTSADDSRADFTLQYRATGVSGDFAADPNGTDVFVRTSYDMQEEYLMNATWLMKNTTMAEVALLKDSNGDPLMRERVINEGQFVNTIQGRPVRMANDMPAMAANSLSVALGDFSQYVVVDTETYQVIVDRVTAKPFTLFHMTTLVGGGLVDWDAVKLIKFGTS